MSQTKALAWIAVIVGLFAIYLSQISQPPVLNVSAVETQLNVGVYRDRSCTIKVSSIDWGILAPGAKRTIAVYVRNEGNTSFILAVQTRNWNPTSASRYLTFSWTSESGRIAVGSVVRVTQDLRVSTSTYGITSFSFDIVYEARQYYIGDINKDGIVDIYDVSVAAYAFGATPSSPRWNPDVDFNQNGLIDVDDVALVAWDFGKT